MVSPTTGNGAACGPIFHASLVCTGKDPCLLFPQAVWCLSVYKSAKGSVTLPPIRVSCRVLFICITWYDRSAALHVVWPSPHTARIPLCWLFRPAPAFTARPLYTGNSLSCISTWLQYAEWSHSNDIRPRLHPSKVDGVKPQRAHRRCSHALTSEWRWSPVAKSLTFLDNSCPPSPVSSPNP
jgi:hypothetical protein